MHRLPEGRGNKKRVAFIGYLGNAERSGEERMANSVFMRVFSGIILGYLFFELLWWTLFQVTNT
ncbi:MAG: hypothetical protein WBW69_05475, partial [Candidatus Korobacteraceae bacterium]